MKIALVGTGSVEPGGVHPAESGGDVVDDARELCRAIYAPEAMRNRGFTYYSNGL